METLKVEVTVKLTADQALEDLLINLFKPAKPAQPEVKGYKSLSEVEAEIAAETKTSEKTLEATTKKPRHRVTKSTNKAESVDQTALQKPESSLNSDDIINVILNANTEPKPEPGAKQEPIPVTNSILTPAISDEDLRKAVKDARDRSNIEKVKKVFEAFKIDYSSQCPAEKRENLVKTLKDLK